MYQWYKGNLHSHTTNSDGLWTPEQAAENYRNEGYSFLCFTDHDRYTDYSKTLGRDDFLVLPGVEATAVLFDEKQDTVCLHHMNGILGTQQMQKNAAAGTFSHMQQVRPDIYYGSDWDGDAAGRKLAKRLKDHGCIVTYNHPVWSRVAPEDFYQIPDIDILEIYNYNTVNECGEGYDVTDWDQMLRKGRHIYAAATDDNHNGGRFPDSFGGFIMVRAQELTHEAICQAILAGDYYASSGPKIYTCSLQGDTLSIQCSPVACVHVIAGGPVATGRTAWRKPDRLLTEAEYHLCGKETYIRVECVDEQGHVAWSNPIWIEQ